MEQHELIRRMVLVDGLSQREVARRLGHSRKTVARAPQSAAPAVYTRDAPRPRPKLDALIPIVRQWLTDDLQRHRKQQHTAVREFERRWRIQSSTQVRQQSLPRLLAAGRETYAIPSQNADARMVTERTPGTIEYCKGTVRCSNALDHP